jgi:hypothetical protein
MPKQLPQDLLDRVRDHLNRHPNGLGLADLEAQLKGAVRRRTLQRRLDEWVRIRAIRAEGVRRGRRYCIVNTPANSTVITPTAGALAITTIPPTITGDIPLSSVGQAIQTTVRRPIADRNPVGYERGFLERHVPNVTRYHSDAIGTHLHELGRTPDGQRPAGTYARDILSRLLIDLSWSSSSLEGNTYSLLDTRELIERGTVAPGKDAKETQMILNHKAAIELLVESAEEVGVDRHTLTNLHALLAENLLDNPRDAGRLRERPIAIGASTHILTAIPQLIEECFALLLDKAAAINDPFEQSFLLVAQLPYLQPFVDANKRTSRLAANISLIESNLVPLSFIDVPERVYVDGLTGI